MLTNFKLKLLTIKPIKKNLQKKVSLKKKNFILKKPDYRSVFFFKNSPVFYKKKYTPYSFSSGSIKRFKKLRKDWWVSDSTFLTYSNNFDTVATTLDFFFKNQAFSNAYGYQGRVSYLKEFKLIPHRFFFAIANVWVQLRDLFLLYELLFFFKITNSYNDVFKSFNFVTVFASLLLYEKLNYFLISPQLFKNFFNFSECLLKIRLTTSNFFFTALDSISYKTLLTGTGGMLHIPIIKYANKLNNAKNISTKKLARRQDIKHKKNVQLFTKKLTQPRSKKFSKRKSQNTIIKKKRPKWIQKTSFVSLFYLCNKFFNALKDFGYLQLRFWLIGHKVYDIFFKRKIIPRWRKQYSRLLFLSPYIIFQGTKNHNGMRAKKARRV